MGWKSHFTKTPQSVLKTGLNSRTLPILMYVVVGISHHGYHANIPVHKIALYYINDHQLLLTDITRDISQEMIIRQVPVSLLRLTFAYFPTIHSLFCYAVIDPEKYLLLCDEVELTVKKYGCSVERVMRRHINKDRRVLNRFVGIYHLQKIDLLCI